MTDTQLYEFKILKRRFNRLTTLSHCLLVVLFICLVFIPITILNTLFYTSVPWAIGSWIVLSVIVVNIFLNNLISKELSNCKYKIKRQKIMDSIPTEWTEIRFVKSNFFDNRLQNRYVRKVLIKKRNDRRINLKCFYIDDTSDLFKDFPFETLMETFDLSTFLD